MSPPITYSAFDLLDAHLNLALVDAGFAFRRGYGHSVDRTAPDIVVWHYMALGALSKAFGTYFDFFEPDVLSRQRDRPTDWAALKADVCAALGVPPGGEVLEPFVYSLFHFLVKVRAMQVHFDDYCADDRFVGSALPVGDGTDYARYLTKGIVASLDLAQLQVAREALVNVLDPAGRVFTADQLRALGYPRRTWQEVQFDGENEDEYDEDPDEEN